MTIRSLIGIAIVIAGIVGAAAVVVGLAMLLFRDGHEYSALALLLGSALGAGFLWGAFAPEREAVEEYGAPEGAREWR